MEMGRRCSSAERFRQEQVDSAIQFVERESSATIWAIVCQIGESSSKTSAVAIASTPMARPFCKMGKANDWRA
jgi:hypothetical protein